MVDFREDLKPIDKYGTNRAFFRKWGTRGETNIKITTDLAVDDVIPIMQVNSKGLLFDFRYCIEDSIAGASKMDLGFYLADSTSSGNGQVVLKDALGTLDLTSADAKDKWVEDIKPKLVSGKKNDMHFRDIPLVKEQLEILDAYDRTFMWICLTVGAKPTAEGVVCIQAAWDEGAY